MIQGMFNEIKDDVITRHLHYIEQKTKVKLNAQELKLMYKYLTSNIELESLEIRDDVKLNIEVQDVLKGKALFNNQQAGVRKLVSEMQSLVREEVTEKLNHTM